MKALVFSRKEGRYVAAAVASRLAPGAGASVGPLSLSAIDAPDLPNDQWVRVKPRLSGICGSDLATIDGRAARYFDSLISFPFVLGHEVVGELEDGTRVVLEPVLGPEARGEAPPFDGAAPGDGNDYGHLVAPPLEPGIQVGFCASTSGGWSTQLVAHRSQIHVVPETMSDETAVMIEPAAAAIHGVLRGNIGAGDKVAVIGAGTMGLCAVAAVKNLTDADTILVGAKHPHQRGFATKFGADTVADPPELVRAVRRAVGCRMIGNDLSGGADVTIDTLGTSASLQSAISMTRPRGRVVLLGMPDQIKLEMTGLWHRETELVGAYTYCTESLPDGSRRKTFDLAMELANEVDLGALVTATYKLDRYRDALRHAAGAGSRGAVKIAFDLRDERHLP